MLSLPIETIEEILGHVNDDDIKTLQSIVLINRNWCKIGIRYLWKKPFNPENSSNNFYKIISTILSFVDEQQKNFLNINDQRIEIPKSTLFDYTHFIRQLDFDKLFLLIKEWIIKNRRFRKTLKKDYYAKNSDRFIYDFSTMVGDSYKIEDLEKLAFFESIFKIIVKNSKGIEKLDLIINNEDWKTHAIPSDYFGVLFNGIDDIHRCLAGLKVLSCDGNFYKASIVNKIKNCSHEIIELNINVWKNDFTIKDDLITEDLKELIQVQKNLKSLTYLAVEGVTNATVEGLQGVVTETLESLQISSGEIRNDELKCLARCKKLKNLSFDVVSFEDPIDLLVNITFPELEVLNVSNSASILENNLDKMKIFIENNGKNLKEINLCKDLSGII